MRRAARTKTLWRFALAVAGMTIGLLPGATTAQPHCNPAEAATSFGKWTSPGLTIQPGLSLPYEPTGVSANPAALRFLVELKSATARRWTLTVRDLDLRVLASMGAGDFVDTTGQPVSRRWTGMLNKKAVVFGLDVEGGEVDLRIDSALVYPQQADGAPQYSVKVKDTPDWMELYPQAPGATKPSASARRAGDLVGMIVSAIEKDGRKESWCCSGVLLSPTILLTNWHCGGMSVLSDDSVWKGDVCPNALIDLGWDQSVERRQYSCKSVLQRNRPLDFVLLRLSPVVGTGSMVGEARPARFNLDPLDDNQDLFIVHHAQCKQKLTSTCRILGASRQAWRPSQGQSGDLTSSGEAMSEFTHSCDTEPGASGAPMFNTRGELVGLHHLGYERDAQNNCDGLNKAVKIKEIFRVIKRESPVIAKEIGIPDRL